MTKLFVTALAAFLVANLATIPAARAADGFWTGATPKAAETKAAPAKAPAKEPTKPAVPEDAPSGLAGIEALEASLADAWERTPLTQRHAMFVARKPEIYGGYVERDGRRFARGEALLTYVEPVGYAWKPQADGLYEFGFTIDFKVKLPNGKILAGQDGFTSFDFGSRYKNREVFMTMTMTLDGIDPGEYVLVYTMHDKTNGKASSFEQPFTITQ